MSSMSDTLVPIQSANQPNKTDQMLSNTSTKPLHVDQQKHDYLTNLYKKHCGKCVDNGINTLIIATRISSLFSSYMRELADKTDFNNFHKSKHYTKVKEIYSKFESNLYNWNDLVQLIEYIPDEVKLKSFSKVSAILSNISKAVSAADKIHSYVFRVLLNVTSKARPQTQAKVFEKIIYHLLSKYSKEHQILCTINKIGLDHCKFKLFLMCLPLDEQTVLKTGLLLEQEFECIVLLGLSRPGKNTKFY